MNDLQDNKTGRFVKQWTEELDNKLRKLYPSMLTEDIAKEMGKRLYAIRNRANFLGLKKDKEWVRETARKNSLNPNHGGRRYQYQKGRMPENKGKKQADYMSLEMIERTKATRFQKGSIPPNAVPIGYERFDKDGYVMIKVAGERKLVLKHRHVCKQHNGPIPEGCNIQFKDGNKHNCEIENLYIISRSKQLKEENSLHARYPEEVRKLIQLKGALNRQINKKLKENE